MATRRKHIDARSDGLQQKLSGIADVRSPTSAEPPILAPQVRATLHAWITEINAADDLAAVGLKPRSTALLYGPPGTGKTTLAHHLAARLGLPLAIVGSEHLMAKYLGDSERIVARLFDALEEDAASADTSGSVLFLDELDAVGHKRVEGGMGADNARNSMLTVLLRRLENYDGYALAATNRPDSLDPALWRRFHMQISVDLPGDAERFAILRRYAAPFDLSDDDTGLLADLTEHASPALLRGLMEGMKRAVVIAPRLGRPLDPAPLLFRTIVAGLAPPPGVKQPALWAHPSLLDELATLAWPPQRKPEP